MDVPGPVAGLLLKLGQIQVVALDPVRVPVRGVGVLVAEPQRRAVLVGRIALLPGRGARRRVARRGDAVLVVDADHGGRTRVGLGRVMSYLGPGKRAGGVRLGARDGRRRERNHGRGPDCEQARTPHHRVENEPRTGFFGSP